MKTLSRHIKSTVVLTFSVILFSSCQPAPAQPVTFIYTGNNVCSGIKLTNKSTYNLRFNQVTPTADNFFAILPNENHTFPSLLPKYQYSIGIGELIISDRYSLKLGVQCLPNKPEIEIIIVTGQSLAVTEDITQPNGLRIDIK